jgi:hypothetical protein
MSQVRQKHFLHLASEIFVFDQNIELTVCQPARGVQIGGAHPRPETVYYSGFCMDHRPVPFEYPDAGFEQAAVACARDGLHDGDVGSGRQEKPDIDAVPSGRPERFDIRGRSGKVSIRQPERIGRYCSDHLVKPVCAGVSRFRRNDTKAPVARL